MKNIVFAGIISALMSGCVTFVPPPATPQEIAATIAAFHQTNWGFLQSYIGRQYINDDGDWLRISAEPSKGELLITVNSISATHSNYRYVEERVIHFRLGVAKGTFNIESSTLFGRDQATVQFDENGQLLVLTGSFRKMQLALSNAEASFVYYGPSGTVPMTPKPMRPDTYSLQKGKTIPVTWEPDAAYQKLRQAGSFGTWESKIGQTFISNSLLLKLEKDEADNLIFVYSSPVDAESKQGRDVFHALNKTNPVALKVLSMPNKAANYFSSQHISFSKDDRITHEYTGTENFFDNGRYLNVYINRGNAIRIISVDRYPDSKKATSSNHYFLPVTKERMTAAIKYIAEQEIERERKRAYAEYNAAQRAAQSEATANAVMQGLASGFSSAQQTNARLDQQSRSFESNLKQKLQLIEQQNQLRERNVAVRAGQIIAANNAAIRAQNTAIANQKLERPASTTAASNLPREQRQPTKQPQIDKAKIAEQNRLAKEAKNTEAVRQQKAQKEKALVDHLAAERRGIRLRAETCPGGGGFPSVMGSRPNIKPKVANCIVVHFEARCPSDRRGSGMTGSIGQFLGQNSCFDNSSPLPRKLSCDVKQAIVEATNVTSCP